MTAPLKIGVIGAHSTGKTSFLDNLDRAVNGVGYRVARVGDLATEARSHGFPILRQHTTASTAWIIARGISKELEAGLSAEIVLVDRPVIDALGYLRAALASRGEAISASDSNYLGNLIRAHLPSYTLLLKTEIDSTIPIDTSKERDTDSDFRVLVGTSIDMVLNEFEVEYLTLTPDNTDQLIGKILTRIQPEDRK